MTANGRDADGLTVVNVFEIDAEKLDSFVALWRERAEFLCRQRGFRSLRLLHAVSEGVRFQVISITEWDGIDALQAVIGQQEFVQNARLAVDALGVIAYPGVYRAALSVTPG